MGDTWRRKTYYHTRVLIDTQRILDPQFSDCVVCLTGPQLEMMRNLTQYLHRRSTFADEYAPNHYLAPTEAEWDDIQAIVASLEDTLMDCEVFTAKLESILDAALCACAGTDGGYTSPVTGPIYQDLEGDGIVEWTPEDPTPTPAEAAACALAQLVYAWNYEILTEVLQPIQEAGHEVLLFLVIEAFAGMIGGPPGLIAGGALFYVIQALLDAWVEGELANVTNALVANKDDLICAMYTEFLDGGDYGDAAGAARTIIDGVSAWSTIDKALFNLTFSPLVMKICQEALTAESDWADANVDVEYCMINCEMESIIGWDVTWPPCESDIFVESGFCSGGNLKCGYNLGGLGGLVDYFRIGDPLVYSSVDAFELTLTWYSALDDEDQAGYLRLYRWNTSTEQWNQFINLQFWVDSVDPLNVATVTLFEADTSMPDVGDLIRIEILTSAQVGASYPTYIMLGNLDMDWTMTEI